MAAVNPAPIPKGKGVGRYRGVMEDNAGLESGQEDAGKGRPNASGSSSCPSLVPRSWSNENPTAPPACGRKFVLVLKLRYRSAITGKTQFAVDLARFELSSLAPDSPHELSETPFVATGRPFCV
jgi:hypothetical protein